MAILSLKPCPGSSGVEQWTENPRVGGSNPPPGTTETQQNLPKSVVTPVSLCLDSIWINHVLSKCV